MAGKPKILVVGSFVMDLIAATDRVPQSGQTVVGQSFHMAPGGKGANQAVQCARLGADVTMLGCVGDDLFGRQMLSAAGDAGVDLSHVRIEPTVSSGIGHVLLVVDGHSAQNRITVIPGANQALTAGDAAWVESCIHRFDMVMLQMEVPLEVNLPVARWARRAGVPVMLNPAPAAPLSDALLQCVTYLTPNEQEAAVETGLPLRTEGGAPLEEDLQSIAAALWKKGVQNTIITLGGHGSAVVSDRGIRYIPIVQMPHVADPTAAGDSFVAALCVGLCVGLTQPQALTFASHTAAITVSRLGAMPSLPCLSEVRALLRERSCRAIPDSVLDVLDAR